MGALKINCFLDEIQMDDILKYVGTSINNSDIYDIEEIQEELFGVIVCVRFIYDFDPVNPEMTILGVGESLILDDDWDELYEDTAVFTSRLKEIVSFYNKRRRAALKQGMQIMDDENVGY
jgi:hypothetical protein